MKELSKLDQAIKLLLEYHNGIYAWDYEDVIEAQELILREKPDAELKHTKNGWILISSIAQ